MNQICLILGETIINSDDLDEILKNLCDTKLINDVPPVCECETRFMPMTVAINILGDSLIVYNKECLNQYFFRKI